MSAFTFTNSISTHSRRHTHLVSSRAGIECWVMDYITGSLVLIMLNLVNLYFVATTLNHRCASMHASLLPDRITLLMNGISSQLKMLLTVSLMFFQVFAYNLCFAINSRVFVLNRHSCRWAEKLHLGTYILGKAPSSKDIY